MARSVARINPTIDPNSVYTEKQIAQGYAIIMKLLCITIIIELGIVTTGLVSGVGFSLKFGQNDLDRFMMVLGPVVFALSELARVPMAIALRLPQNGFWIKLALVIGIAFCMYITTKTVAQLAEMQFSPRLVEVVKKKSVLVAAQSGATLNGDQIGDADKMLDQRKKELEDADKQLAIATRSVADLPKPVCTPISWRDRNGVMHRGQTCKADPRVEPMTKMLVEAQTARAAAYKRLQEVTTTRQGITRVDSEKAVREAQTAYREAVMNSQIHSFAAAVFGKDPTEVTEGEVHWFLRLMIFVPAIAAAISATMLALATVVRITVKPTHVEILDGGHYAFGGHATEIIQRATEAHLAGLQAKVPPAPPPEAAPEAMPQVAPKPVVQPAHGEAPSPDDAEIIRFPTTPPPAGKEDLK